MFLFPAAGIGVAEDAAHRALVVAPDKDAPWPWGFTSVLAKDIGHANLLYIQELKPSCKPLEVLGSEILLAGVMVREKNLGGKDFPRVLALDRTTGEDYNFRLDELVAAFTAGGETASHAASLLSYMIAVLSAPDATCKRVRYSAAPAMALIECVVHWGKHMTIAFATGAQIRACECLRSGSAYACGDPGRVSVKLSTPSASPRCCLVCRQSATLPREEVS